MQIIRKLFAISYSSIIFLFICRGLALIFFAALELWHGLNPSESLPLRDRFNSIQDPSQLPQTASIQITAGVLLVAWAIFIRMNKSAEELQPEAMAKTKSEERKVA